MGSGDFREAGRGGISLRPGARPPSRGLVAEPLAEGGAPGKAAG